MMREEFSNPPCRHSLLSFTKLYLRNIWRKTAAPSLLAAGNRACCHDRSLSMVEENISPNPDPATSPTGRKRRTGAFVIALVAVALVAGAAGNMLSTAFGQGFGPGFAGHHFGMHGGGPFGGPLTPAQIDERIERMTRHMAIELDATADQQAKVASIAKAAAADLRALREKALAARSQAVALLTAPTIDRTAIERLRAEQIGLAETASKRIAQALADTAEVLSPEQRRKVVDWIGSGPWWSRWHRG
jgi:protein CpxP